MVKSPEGVCNNASNGLLVETTRSVRLLKSGDGVFFNFLVSVAFCMYYIKKKNSLTSLRLLRWMMCTSFITCAFSHSKKYQPAIECT